MTSINRIVIVPGNGMGGDVRRSNWYGAVERRLRDALAADGDGVAVLLRDMPDPLVARRDVWLPFMRDELGVDARTLVIGHSSGAVAALRLAEQQAVGALLLVSAYTSDLGDANERASGYFDGAWRHAAAAANARHGVVLFGSTDDPFLPAAEQDAVARGTGADYRRYADRGHFMTREFDECVDAALALVRDSRRRRATPAPAPAVAPAPAPATAAATTTTTATAAATTTTTTATTAATTTTSSS